MQAQGFWFWMEGVMNIFFWADLVMNFFVAYEVRGCGLGCGVAYEGWRNRVVMRSYFGAGRGRDEHLLG